MPGRAFRLSALFYLPPHDARPPSSPIIAPAPAVKRQDNFSWYSARDGDIWVPYAIAMYPAAPPHKMVIKTTDTKTRRNCLLIAMFLINAAQRRTFALLSLWSFHQIFRDTLGNAPKRKAPAQPSGEPCQPFP